MTDDDLSRRPLHQVDSDAWAVCVQQHFDEFLQDHAACERKAAATAMSLITKYSDRERIIDPMIAVAREELEHFQQVCTLLKQRGKRLRVKDRQDEYAQTLIQSLRHGREERFLDRLVMSSLVEARSEERFRVLAATLDDHALRVFYDRLAKKEAGHYRVFLRLAKSYFPSEDVHAALVRLASVESQILKSLPVRAVMH